MATVNFTRISETTEKAIKVIIRESGFDIENCRNISQKHLWIPKSVCSNLQDNSVEVADRFYNKNIAVDVYGAFMNAMANS